jgi:uncharacterized protein DUF4387
MASLSELATVFRSKNADPFMTTIDIYFPTPLEYNRVKVSGVLTKARVAEAYSMPEAAVYGIYHIDSLHAIKVTIFKYSDGIFIGQGDPQLRDMFGAQQHIPLLDIEIPVTSAHATAPG